MAMKNLVKLTFGQYLWLIREFPYVDTSPQGVSIYIYYR